jgi:hypothetical protein
LSFTIRSSNRLARATEGSVQTERDALLASTQPIIVVTGAGVGLTISADAAEVRLSIRNIGNGPAFLRAVEFATGSHEPLSSVPTYDFVLPPKEDTLVGYRLSKDETYFDELRQDYGEFAFGINYDDISGSQRLRTVVRAEIFARNGVRVLAVGLYRCDAKWERDKYPFAGRDPYAESSWLEQQPGAQS